MRCQSSVMIARIHRKISQPAATNNVPTISSLPYQDTVAAFSRLCCLTFVISSVGCGDGVLPALLTCGGSREAIVMGFPIPEKSVVSTKPNQSSEQSSEPREGRTSDARRLWEQLGCGSQVVSGSIFRRGFRASLSQIRSSTYQAQQRAPRASGSQPQGHNPRWPKDLGPSEITIRTGAP